MIKDPELVKQLTVKDFEHFTDHRSFVDPESEPIWGNNLFSLKGKSPRAENLRHFRNKLVFRSKMEGHEGNTKWILYQQQNEAYV